MTLLKNEEVILTSNDNFLVLTNQRIQMSSKTWGESYEIVICHEDISSIEVKYKSYFVLLILGLLGILAGLNYINQNPPILFAGIILLIIWWFTRTHVISVSSDGKTSLNFQTRGMTEAAIEDFVFKLSSAKQDRIEKLFKIS